MPTRLILAGATIAALFAATLPPAARAEPDRACVSWTTQARFNGVGYNHIVILKNACQPPIPCSVKTNANPKAQTVKVPGRDKIEVVTFIGSPLQGFTPEVKCTEPQRRRGDE